MRVTSIKSPLNICTRVAAIIEDHLLYDFMLQNLWTDIKAAQKRLDRVHATTAGVWNPLAAHSC